MFSGIILNWEAFIGRVAVFVSVDFKAQTTVDGASLQQKQVFFKTTFLDQCIVHVA